MFWKEGGALFGSSRYCIMEIGSDQNSNLLKVMILKKENVPGLEERQVLKMISALMLVTRVHILSIQYPPLQKVLEKIMNGNWKTIICISCLK